ncbi:MAG: aminotransferase class III-fold pyridoxal phosphate-dependent enzyme, partial [Gemmatimonadaceae bacterium]
GKLFAPEHSGVVPDMLTLAKPLAGGLPMGAVLLSEEIARTVQPGDHATTFGGGPFVASVALHVFDRLSEGAVLEKGEQNGAWLGERLADLAVGTPRIRAIRGVGYMWGIDVVEPAANTVARALDAGLLILSAGDYTLRLLPPLIAGRSELEAGLAMLEGVVS